MKFCFDGKRYLEARVRPALVHSHRCYSSLGVETDVLIRVLVRSNIRYMTYGVLAEIAVLRHIMPYIPYYTAVLTFVCLFGGLRVHWLAVPIVHSATSEDPTCDGLLMPEVNCTSSYRATYILI
jgi:hypothetical protein